MTTRKELIDSILEHRTGLFKFAMRLTGNTATAEDLLQDTFVQAISHIDSFRVDSNLAAWLFTIMRNKSKSDYRKRRREVEDVDETYMATLKTLPNQISSVQLKAFTEALGTIPENQMTALTLVAVNGFSYEEAADICNVAIGTVKSRLNRARAKLLEHMPEVDALFIAAASAAVQPAVDLVEV